MAVRKCPSCLAVVPAGAAVAFSDSIECPGCHTGLEVSLLSRSIAAWAGLAAGALIWQLTRRASAPADLEWVLPVFYAILAFGVVAPLVLMLTGDLQLRPADEVADVGHELPDDGQGHGGGAHH